MHPLLSRVQGKGRGNHLCKRMAPLAACSWLVFSEVEHLSAHLALGPAQMWLPQLRCMCTSVPSQRPRGPTFPPPHEHGHGCASKPVLRPRSKSTAAGGHGRDRTRRYINVT